LSTTVVALFRDALMHPDASGIKLNFGNNRVSQKPNDRYVEYYDITKSDEPVPVYPE